MEHEQVMYWRGKPLDKMSAAELIEIISWQHKQLEAVRSENARRLDFLFDAARQRAA